MTDGVSATLGNSMLTTMTTSPAMSWQQLHTGAGPGSAGTSNVSSVTTRKAVTWASPSGSSVSANGTLPSYTSWAGTNGEVVTSTSYWTASTAGTFDAAITMSASVTMNTGDNLSFTAITASIPNAS